MVFSDDDMYFMNYATSGGFSTSSTNAVTVTRWNIPTLLADVSANGRALVHNREAPWFSTITNGRAPWQGEPAFGAIQDRRWSWTDGIDPIHGSPVLDVTDHPDFKGKLLVMHHVTYMPGVGHWGSALPIAVLENPQVDAEFQVTLQFEGTKLSAYQRQIEVERVSVPEVVVLT